MVLRMVFPIDRREGGRLRHEEEAEQQHYERVSPLFAPTTFHFEYSIAPNRGPRLWAKSAWSGN